MTNEYKGRNDEKRPEDAAERWDRDFVRELHAIRRPKILKRAEERGGLDPRGELGT